MTKNLIIAVLLGALIGTVISLFQEKPQMIGSARTGEEYISTSTAPTTSQGAQVLTTTRTLKTGQFGSCALGSVVITGANTGGLDFYNATTSNVNLRTGQKATSSILIASLPPSLVAGTYIFDAQCTDGLLMSLSGSGVPTTTILYR